MTFELIITRAFPAESGQDQDLLAPLCREDFELLMDGAPIRRRLKDGSCWLWHKQNIPWLAARFREDGPSGQPCISLVLSYSHIQYLKVWADAFELALRLAKSIRAAVVEGWNHQLVNKENVSELLDPKGPYVREQAAFWKDTVTQLNDRMQAPLEYPIDTHDAVDDYFVFFLDPAQAFNATELIAKLALSVDPDSVTKERFALMDGNSGNILASVLLRSNDAALQIWPFYWMEPFAVVAAETLKLAVQIQGQLGGKLYFKDKPLTPQLVAELEEHIKGLGVEFLFWMGKMD